MIGFHLEFKSIKLFRVRYNKICRYLHTHYLFKSTGILLTGICRNHLVKVISPKILIIHHLSKQVPNSFTYESVKVKKRRRGRLPLHIDHIESQTTTYLDPRHFSFRPTCSSFTIAFTHKRKDRKAQSAGSKSISQALVF